MDLKKYLDRVRPNAANILKTMTRNIINEYKEATKPVPPPAAPAVSESPPPPEEVKSPYCHYQWTFPLVPVN